MTQLIDLTAADGALREPQWLPRAEAVHRQLRTQLPEDYAATMQRVFAGGGRMLVAADGDAVSGLAVWRLAENTADGFHLYIDDLVTDALRRSTGVGRLLIRELEGRARAAGCGRLRLDSGVQRERAHRFYFREGFTVVSFSFRKPL